MQTPRPQPTEPAPPPSSAPAQTPLSEPSVDTTRHFRSTSTKTQDGQFKNQQVKGKQDSILLASQSQPP